MSKKAMTMHDLKEILPMLGARETFLDVRTPEEFAEGHIAGAKNIPHEEVLSHLSELKQFEKVYVFCRSGKRAKIAFDSLSQSGLNNLVCITDGGMMNWIDSGYPLEKN